MQSNEPEHRSHDDLTTLTVDLANGGNIAGLTAYEMLGKYENYLKKVARTPDDADDIRQNLKLKIFRRYDNTPEVWERIKNKNSYMFRMIQNAVNDFYGGVSSNFDFVSYDDNENESLRSVIDNLSDNGASAEETQDEIDRMEFRLQLEAEKNKLSPYENEVIQLNYVDGVKPRDVARMLKSRYPEKHESEIQQDCNAIKAKFRARLRKLLPAGQQF